MNTRIADVTGGGPALKTRLGAGLHFRRIEGLLPRQQTLSHSKEPHNGLLIRGGTILRIPNRGNFSANVEYGKSRRLVWATLSPSWASTVKL
jgi:hypothetical protein